MKTTMLLLALLGLAAPHAHAAPPLTYETVVRVSLPVVNVSSAIFAFQNTSTTEDVLIHRLEMSNASTMTVAGGLAGYWVYMSTSLTHSTAVSTWTYSHTNVLASKPSHITVSSAPYNILLEGDANLLGADAGMTGVPPIMRPLVVNNDEAAASQWSDFWSENETLGAGGFKEGPQPLVLPANTQRALVIRYRRIGATDFGAGSLYIRVVYSRR